MKGSLVTTTMLFLFCITAARLNAQQISSISGRVANAANEPLTGNVIVLSAADSGFIKGTSFLNTAFEITNINRKEVLLKFTSLQFRDTIIKVTYNGQANIHLGTILVGSGKYQLNEVQVTSQVPMVRYSANGNIEVNVAKTILASSNSVNEILSRSPNVVIDDGGQIAVFGKGEAIFYLNGKRITREQMSAIPTSQIARIEIISNPSAKYDAEGKAVINIITKVNMQEGIIGTVSQHVTTSDFAGTNANTFLDLSYMKGKFSLVGNYGLLVGKSREYLYTTRTRPEGPDYMNSDLITDWKRKFNNYSNFGLGAQYNINERSNISLAYSGYVEKQGGSQDSRNAITTNDGTSHYTSNIAVNQERWNHTGTLNYNNTLDSLGSGLFLGTQLSYFNGDNDDFIDEKSIKDGTADGRLLKNLAGLKIYISASQADYTKVFSASSKLDLGVKFGYVNTRASTTFLISEKGEDFIYNKDLSNNFEYIEKIPAAYVNYNGKLGKVNYSLGARGEWTNYDLNTSVGGGQTISDSYFNIFPNLLLNTSMQQVKMRFSYAARISRPRYQSLNPIVFYQDPFTTIEGNPFLVPEKTHAFEVGLNYKKYDFRVGYNYTLNPFTAAALRGDSANTYVLKAINLDKDNTFFASLSRQISIKWWTSLNTVSVSYSKSTDNKYNYAMVDSKPYVYLYSSNTFNVDNLFKLQLLAWYLGDKYYGVRYEKHRSTVTLGIEKDFFKNALKLSFTANDIFHKTNTSGIYDVGQTTVFYDRTYNTNYFRFIATYNFGNLKKTNYKIRQTGQSENNRAK
ncbi:TonB-dependent receptor [uncultured Chitinophaga sp.]|jgi:Outer membrane receptor proteins, mostly Fe transport|uniref:TonB-dependent receptor domain-containing protein n=1 Tax=uncultured Chitinophaga sp. TaxID=339340 RepID=UPI00262C4C6B|nr:TonB-dependent receptor [uncultured Chitinophaga sp.]